MKKFFIYLIFVVFIILFAAYFSLSNSSVQKFLLKSIFESRTQSLFVANESINFDELEIFFCGSGSPLSMMPEGAQCMAFIIGSDIYVIDNGSDTKSSNFIGWICDFNNELLACEYAIKL